MGFVEFSRALRAAASPAFVADVRGVLERGALNIKRDLVAEMGASTHFGQIAPSISYDARDTADGVEVEVGPDHSRRGGALANIAYFGTSRGGGTVPDPVWAMNREAPNVIRYIDVLIAGLL